MRVVVALKPLRWILRWTQRVLFAGAVSMLAYCGFVLTDTWIFQKAERRQLERLLADRREASGAARQNASRAKPSTSPPTVAGGLIGRIDIPRLGLTAIVVEGTSRTILRRAVGHIQGTPLPGQQGNVGISGHRDTFFRPLRNIRLNDVITLTTLLGEYRYRVVSTQIVSPYDVAVLDPSRNEILTLVTCYPFYFVGSAPARFIVRAERVIAAKYSQHSQQNTQHKTRNALTKPAS
jgi:sortase A